MVMRKDTTIPCIIGIFVLGYLATSSVTNSVMGIFNSLVYATNELMSTIFIISIISGMGQLLTKTGINEVMIKPFSRLIKTPTLAYWIIGILMMVISWFFWPSPAVALMGAVLLPIAVQVGLPPLGVAMAMNIFGHGIALSGDFVIQGAPKLTADAAGLPVSEVVNASVPLVFIMGIVTTIIAFYYLKRDMKNGSLTMDTALANIKVTEEDADNLKNALSLKTKRFYASIIPILFAIDVLLMAVMDLSGGDATALIGGTALFILICIVISIFKSKGLDAVTEYLIKGLHFGFRIFGPVIPIAAFFYLGDAGFVHIFGDVLPEGSQGLVNDLGIALAHTVPLNKAIGSVTLTTVGAITGLDGSGFSGISLAGSVAKLFATAIGRGTATLTALGQIAAIWVGGGTLIPWALLPAAAICGVDPFELARRNFKPVVIGLVITTIVSIFLI